MSAPGVEQYILTVTLAICSSSVGENDGTATATATATPSLTRSVSSVGVVREGVSERVSEEGSSPSEDPPRRHSSNTSSRAFMTVSE
jgi:hypothetical protein